MTVDPVNDHDPVFDQYAYTVSDMSRMLPVGVDIGQLYTDLVITVEHADNGQEVCFQTVGTI